MTTVFSTGENPLRATKLNQAISERIERTGDTMTGPLVLSGDPTDAFGAATKQYVDAHVSGSSGGGTTTSGLFVTGQNATILTDDRTGLLIPGYVYPNNPYTDAAFLNLLDMIRRYHDIPVIYVINPANGPGAVWDGNYAAAIRLLRGAGAAVIGYISTAYAVRDPNLVKTDVVTWQTLYETSPIDGIFFDEMPWDRGVADANITLYQEYCSYVHDRGLQIVVGNPGTVQQGLWYKADPPTADIIVTWENSAYPVEGDLYLNFSPDGHVDYSWKRNSVMVYNQPFNAASFAMMRKHVKWLWATGDNLPNPYDTFPSYMESNFLACRQYAQAFFNQLTTDSATAATTAAAGVAEQVLKTYSVPANTLYDGKRLVIKSHGIFIGSTRAKTVRMKFGTFSFTPGVAAATATYIFWRYEMEIINRTGNSQRCKVVYWVGDSANLAVLAPSGMFSSDLTENIATNLAIQVTGQVGGVPINNDIQAQSFTIDLIG